MKILVLGMPKTGTTMLFYKIKNSMPESAKTLFEQFSKKFFQKPLPESFLAKILIDKPYLAQFDHALDFEQTVIRPFDKKVLIVRDPRDQLISSLLFFIRHHDFSEKQFKEYIGLLQRKEKNPRSVNLKEIQDYCTANFRKQATPPTWKGGEPVQSRQVLTSLLGRKDIHVAKYEDIIDGNCKQLEEYLGFPLEKQTEVGKEFQYVVRSKTYNNWKHWFTPSDVEYYKKVLGPFMAPLGYGDDWELARAPSIDARLGSEYAMNIINENRVKKWLKPFPRPPEATKVAVFAHVFYMDLWDEMKSYLENISVPFDLYVNLVKGEGVEKNTALIKKDFPLARITISPNRGYDVGGFVEQINQADLSQYLLICKIHTKKSLHKNTIAEGKEWRKGLFDAVLGSPELVSEILKDFAENPRIGMAGSDRYFSLNTPFSKGYVEHHQQLPIRNEISYYSDICQKLGISPSIENLCFVAGTMFWCRADIIQKIKDSGFTLDYFEESEKRLGTRAHAFERVFGALVRDKGYYFLGIKV